MNLGDLIDTINELSDEDFEPNTVVSFINDAIAKVNIECDSVFPFVRLTESGDEYEGFNETWQRMLIVPYAVGRSKQKEASQFEYADAYGEFYVNLTQFKSKYKIPDKYKDTSLVSSYENDLSNNPYGW